MKKIALLGLTALLAACAGTDNSPQPTPLKEVKNSVNLQSNWHMSFGSSNWGSWLGFGDDVTGLFRFAPDVTGDSVYMAGVNGVAGFSAVDGRKVGELRADNKLAGGVGAGGGLVVAGTLKGEVYGWETDGKLRWQARVSSEMVSPPVVSEGVAVVRTVDGKVWGLDAKDGKVRWQFQRSQPSLILRNYAPVTIADGAVYIGLASGRMASLALSDGRVLWESVVAQPKGATELERISDVTSAPVVSRGTVCAVAFQGKVGCFAVSNGSMLWSRDISSYAGLAMDADKVYVTDETGNIQAFERSGGRSLWKQADLYGRRVSAPAVYAGYVAVGDFEGYIHLLSPSDGSIVARLQTDKSRVLVAPHVVNSTLVVQTESGGLHALAVK